MEELLCSPIESHDKSQSNQCQFLSRSLMENHQIEKRKLRSTKPAQQAPHQNRDQFFPCYRQGTGSRIIHHLNQDISSILSNNTKPRLKPTSILSPQNTHHFKTRNFPTAPQPSRRRIPHSPGPRSPRVSAMPSARVLHFPCRPRLSPRRPQDHRRTDPYFSD